MNFKLNIVNGKVKYLNRYNNSVVGSDTSADSALWLLGQGMPERSEEFEGYPIAVKTQNGSEYFFSGEWLMGAERDVLSGDDQAQNGQSASCGPDYCDIEEAPRKSARKRRMKDVVCE